MYHHYFISYLQKLSYLQKFYKSCWFPKTEFQNRTEPGPFLGPQHYPLPMNLRSGTHQYNTHYQGINTYSRPIYQNTFVSYHFSSFALIRVSKHEEARGLSECDAHFCYSGARVRDSSGCNNSICIRFNCVGRREIERLENWTRQTFYLKGLKEQRRCIWAPPPLQGSAVSIEKRYTE